MSQFSSYQIYFEPSTSNFGGAALLAKDNIEIIAIRDDLKLQNSGQTYRIENIWIECQKLGSKTNVIVGVIYRHPKFNIGAGLYVNLF